MCITNEEIINEKIEEDYHDMLRETILDDDCDDEE